MEETAGALHGLGHGYGMTYTYIHHMDDTSWHRYAVRSTSEIVVICYA